MEAKICRSRETAEIVWIASHLQKYERRKIMKSSRIVLMLGLLPVLVACSPMNGDTCPDRHVNLIAKIGNKTKPSILQVKPDTIVVKEGCEFEVRFSGGLSVSTVGKTQAWLTKSSQSTSPIKIKAPSGTAQEEPYKYAIVVDEIGTLDPRARVTR